jgi:hypothetical protein
MTSPAIQISIKNMDPSRTLFVETPEDPHAASTVHAIAPGASALLPLRDSAPIRLATTEFTTGAPMGAGRLEAPPVVNQEAASIDKVPGPGEPTGAVRLPRVHAERS